MNPKQRIETLEEVFVEMGHKLIQEHQRLAAQARSNLNDRRDQYEVCFTIEKKDGGYTGFMKIKRHHRIATPLGFLRIETGEHNG